MNNQKAPKTFAAIFAYMIRLVHYFSESDAYKFAQRWGLGDRSLGRYKNGENLPSWHTGMQMLVDNHISIENIMKMYRGEYPTLEDIKQRINAKGKVGDNPIILVTPIESEPKAKWIVKNNRVLINITANMSKQKLELWRMADFILLYNLSNPDIARLFRLDPNRLPIETDASTLKQDKKRYPGIEHEKYMEFHLLPDVWFDIWDVNWYPIYNTENVTPPLPLTTYLSNFFQTGKKKDTPPLSLSQTPKEPPYMQTAADDGDGLPRE